MNLDTIKKILAAITFAPSCVDMDWEWEVVAVEGEVDAANGWLLRTTFQRPNRDSGTVSKGFGRWWHVPADVTESGVVKTAYAAARLILEHELMESFKYEGYRLFDPHHTVDDLLEACFERKARASYERMQPVFRLKDGFAGGSEPGEENT